MKLKVFRILVLVFTLLIPIDTTAKTLIHGTGPDENRVIIVLAGDGFTITEQDTFNSLVNKLIDSLLVFTPYREYGDFIKFYRMNLISPESGANDNVIGTKVETILGASFNTNFNSTSLDIALTEQVINNNFSRWEAVFVLINTYKTSGGGSNGKIGFYGIGNGVAANTVRHELGHAFGGLADEYVTLSGVGQTLSDYSEPNVTARPDSTPEFVKWNVWLDMNNLPPWPIKNSEIIAGEKRIGLFAGAKYVTGGYRPNLKWNGI